MGHLLTTKISQYSSLRLIDVQVRWLNSTLVVSADENNKFVYRYCPSLCPQSTWACAVSLFYCFLAILPLFLFFSSFSLFFLLSSSSPLPITIIIKFQIRNDFSIAGGKNYYLHTHSPCRSSSLCFRWFFVFFVFLISIFIHSIRIIITKNCEDVCCRRRYFVKKSTNYAGNAISNHYRRPCELKNFNAATTDDNDIRIKSMALIYSSSSSSSHLKQPICVGTLIHPRVVMTTLVCASM